jgi:hypothetical protein
MLRALRSHPIVRASIETVSGGSGLSPSRHACSIASAPSKLSTEVRA